MRKQWGGQGAYTEGGRKGQGKRGKGRAGKGAPLGSGPYVFKLNLRYHFLSEVAVYI